MTVVPTHVKPRDGWIAVALFPIGTRAFRLGDCACPCVSSHPQERCGRISPATSLAQSWRGRWLHHAHSLVRRRIVAHVWPDVTLLGQNSLTGVVMCRRRSSAALAVQWPSNPSTGHLFRPCALVYSALYARLLISLVHQAPALTLRGRA